MQFLKIELGWITIIALEQLENPYLKKEILSKPDWLKIPLHVNSTYSSLKQDISDLKLVTVCQEAHCPNIGECWSSGTATFMILGDTCTRACRFCNVKTAAKGQPVDSDEPLHLAHAIKKMNLDYVVLTCVDRDDLEDFGASHFVACIRAIKEMNPHVMIEFLIGDFRGDKSLLKQVVDARPDVIAHNIETVKELTPYVRDARAGYDKSLSVLKMVKELNPSMYTKSSIMVGLGETTSHVEVALRDLRGVGVDIVTVGQYLRPTLKHLPVVEYVVPATFKYYEELSKSIGFMYAASGPYVRSSYKAFELFMKAIKRGERV